MSKKDEGKGAKFPKELLKADKKQRRKYFSDLVIAHPLLVETFRAVSTEIQQADPGSLIFVFGPAGAGKSTLARKVKEQVTADLLSELNEDRGRYPVVMTELWAQDSGNYNLRDLYRGLLDSMREPCVDSKVIIEDGNDGSWIEIMRRHRKAGSLELRNATLKAFEFRRPSAVLIDEAQHLATVSSGRKVYDQLDAVKSLANKAQLPIVLFGTYQLLPFRNLSGQLSRRSSDIHLRRYNSKVASELTAFINVVGSFQQHLPLEREPDLVTHWDYLYERSIGCVGVLKSWLLKALISALRQDSSTIELKHLETTALSVAQCDKMATEALEGEGKLTETTRARAMLRLRLSLNTDKARLSKRAELPSESKAKKKRGRPFKRKPARDPVGNADHDKTN
jgi:AAA domain-containing protein